MVAVVQIDIEEEPYLHQQQQPCPQDGPLGVVADWPQAVACGGGGCGRSIASAQQQKQQQQHQQSVSLETPGRDPDTLLLLPPPLEQRQPCYHRGRRRHRLQQWAADPLTWPASGQAGASGAEESPRGAKRCRSPVLGECQEEEEEEEEDQERGGYGDCLLGSSDRSVKSSQQCQQADAAAGRGAGRGEVEGAGGPGGGGGGVGGGGVGDGGSRRPHVGAAAAAAPPPPVATAAVGAEAGTRSGGRGLEGIMETPEARERRIQREIRAAAAERRFAAAAPAAGGRAGGAGGGVAAPPPTPLQPSAAAAAGPEGAVSQVQQFQQHRGGSSAQQQSPHASALSGPWLPGVTSDVAAAATATSADAILEVSSLQQQQQQQELQLQLRFESVAADVAERLFDVVFGASPPSTTLSQWSRQGFRFSDDPATSVGLVQREGGPCGVLAPVQALAFKYLLYPDDAAVAPAKAAGASRGGEGQGRAGAHETQEQLPSEGVLPTFTEAEREGALVSAMTEALWVAGEEQRAVLAVLSNTTLLPPSDEGGGSCGGAAASASATSQQACLPPSSEPLVLGSPAALQQALRVAPFASFAALREGVQRCLPAFQSDCGALLLLFSALLSRGLENVQSDRDDPEPPLVTKPFGHASQEIVNLLLCGRAVANVFDGVMDLGGGMALQGIPGQVEVGFLTLLEALHLCKVGQYLKRPRLPIWVVGSESHYTVLFARNPQVQAERDAEAEERRVRDAFDRRDASGGGGFITPEQLNELAAELGINLPDATRDELASAMGVVVWNELWQALLRLDTSQGGYSHLAPTGGSGGVGMGAMQFDLFHFNGIAKSVAGSQQQQQQLQDEAAASGIPAELIQRAPTPPIQRPRLTKVHVNVPPRWDAASAAAGTAGGSPECMALTPYIPPPFQIGETASGLFATAGGTGSGAGEGGGDSHEWQASLQEHVPQQQHQQTTPGAAVADSGDSTRDSCGQRGTQPGQQQQALYNGQPFQQQHTPLADCIRTRWPRAECWWEGDAPSIV